MILRIFECRCLCVIKTVDCIMAQLFFLPVTPTRNFVLPCALRKNLPALKRSFMRRTSGHCVGNLWTVNLLCILYNQRDATYTVFFIIISALHVSGGFSAHHQELIKLYVQPWVLTGFPPWSYIPSTPAVDSRKAWQDPRLHIQFYKLLLMGVKTSRNMESADNNKNTV